MPDLFDSLKPFIWPTYYEEGPPKHVQLTILGDKVLTSQFGSSTATKSILELMTLGYRPVTMLAILKVLYDSNGNGLHGMEIGRELEKKFGVPEGYFTRSRYYTDRVGKVLSLMSRLGFVEENLQNTRGGTRKYTSYRIPDSSRENVRARLDALTDGKQLSLFVDGHTDESVKQNGNGNTRVRSCQDCGYRSNSSLASYCERCGGTLNFKCENCSKPVLVSFSFCNFCGTRLA